MAAPNITVQRTPTRSATRPIRMPPTPTQLSDPASAGVERAPPKSAAMALSDTTATHGAPNEKASVNNATVATIQERRVSMVPVGTDVYFTTAPGRRRAAREGTGRQGA